MRDLPKEPFARVVSAPDSRAVSGAPPIMRIHRIPKKYTLIQLEVLKKRERSGLKNEKAKGMPKIYFLGKFL
jgi:hypothetical protein